MSSENPFDGQLTTDAPLDFYELLQISQNAEPETIHRVYRLLAQRFHPDNRDTGDQARFMQLTEAYEVLSDPTKRAQYDLAYHQLRQDRWRPTRLASSSDPLEIEQAIRATVLEVLYERRRAEPNSPGVFLLDLEGLTGQPREHLEFTLWYLTRKGFVSREDGSKLAITVDGVDYFEGSDPILMSHRRLQAHEGKT